MSSKHLSKNSEQPPKSDGKLRLYAMKVCPYSQKVLLVLKAKDIAHDVVYINLHEKPEWYSAISPTGNVPVLDAGSTILEDSQKICDFLDENHPNNPLYPSNPEQLIKDKILINEIPNLSKLWHSCVFKEETKTSDDWAKTFYSHMKIFEDELNQRKTKFFGGAKPGMVDYCLWPFAERSKCVQISLNEELPLKVESLPNLIEWKQTMAEEPVIKELYMGPEKFWEIARHKLAGTVPNYDE